MRHLRLVPASSTTDAAVPTDGGSDAGTAVGTVVGTAARNDTGNDTGSDTGSDTGTAGGSGQRTGETVAGTGGATIPAPRRAAAQVRLATDDDVPLMYVPARLVLALAGRCSCRECCTAYAEHRPEPHDPRRRHDRSAGLRAI